MVIGWQGVYDAPALTVLQNGISTCPFKAHHEESFPKADRK